MQNESTSLILHTLRQQVIDTRAAYHQGMKGVTYDDMAAAARRYLTMLGVVDRAAGRKPRAVTSASVAYILRAL